MKRSNHPRISRRGFVAGGLAGAGLLVRSLATGLPPAFLAAPGRARAQQLRLPPQTLILATSSAGDPINCNCPGSYIDGAAHPMGFAAPVDVDLGEVRTRAAAPWADLPGRLRRRLAFVHHATRSPAHSDYRKVMGLHGAVRATAGNGPDMLVSLLADLDSAAVAGTQHAHVQAEPLPLAREEVTLRGRTVQTVDPSDLATLFAPVDGEAAPLASLRSIREQTLAAVYADLRADGSAVQRSFVERYLRSAEQARALGEGLLDGLADLPLDGDAPDGPEHQVAAAVILAAARVAPVITVKIPFGGDNHKDPDLLVEEAETTAGVATIGRLFELLRGAALHDDVTFALLNVFGRTLTLNRAGGRNHNRDHAVMVAFGAAVRSGVYGGVEMVDGRARCLTLPAADGGPPIARDATLEAAGASLALALGHDRALVERHVRGGRVIAGWES